MLSNTPTFMLAVRPCVASTVFRFTLLLGNGLIILLTLGLFLLLFFFQTVEMDQVMQFVEPGRQFVKDSIRLVKRCTKPDRKGTQAVGNPISISVIMCGNMNPESSYTELTQLSIDEGNLLCMCNSFRAE